MARKLKGSAVVITGASSGIGRATALEFAKKGARLALVARREAALRSLARECEEAGGQAMAMPADVTDERAVQEVARAAANSYGRLDVWVNNAAVTLFARFEDAPLEDYRRVIETNLWGYVYGARAALPYFREQGSGVLINNGSILSKHSQPYVGAYTMSKHAVRALGVVLRQELSLDGAKDISVCTIMPATIDTPLFQHAGNYVGRAAKAMPPVYPAEKVARAIVACARRPQREVFVGTMGRTLNLQAALAPGRTERSLAKMTDKQHLFRDEPAPPSPGNLFEPVPEGTGVSGGWGGPRKTRVRRGAMVGLAALGWLWLRSDKSR